MIWLVIVIGFSFISITLMVYSFYTQFEVRELEKRIKVLECEKE
jgi:hypothetical protein